MTQVTSVQLVRSGHGAEAGGDSTRQAVHMAALLKTCKTGTKITKGQFAYNIFKHLGLAAANMLLLKDMLIIETTSIQALIKCPEPTHFLKHGQPDVLDF